MPVSDGLTWGTTSATVNVGETITVNVTYSMAPTSAGITSRLNSLATATLNSSAVTFTGVSAGTVTIPSGTEVGGMCYTSNVFTLTVTAPAEDESYLNKRGLTHFWENIDEIKQDKLTAGTNITISANNTISASQPTVGNATLTIQKNGTNVQTFTANATSNKTANITVPTKTSDLTNDSGFVNSTALAAKQDRLAAGAHINITGSTIKAVDYVHSDDPVSTTAVTPVVTNNMIADGTITADKFATGATLKLTLSTSDIGEGAALAANTLYGVYE